MFTFLGVYCDISIPHSAITFTAIGFTFSAGLVPAEKTLIFLSNDCMKPCDIWLRQLFPVQRINIFIVQLFFQAISAVLPFDNSSTFFIHTNSFCAFVCRNLFLVSVSERQAFTTHHLLCIPARFKSACSL